VRYQLSQARHALAEMLHLAEGATVRGGAWQEVGA